MLRKIILAVSAAAALGAAALAPTSASAWGHGHWHGYHGWHGGYGFYGPAYVASGPDCYRVRRVVDTVYGPRVRRVVVCN